MINDLLLLSGNDIPFPEAQLIIHQPNIKEIALMGEEDFYTGCEFLNFSKENLEKQDKLALESYSDFEIIMSIMREKNAVVTKNKQCVLTLLTLLFPQYSVQITIEAIELEAATGEKTYLNKDNFEHFKVILNKIFCLTGRKEDEYNPAGEMAKRIAEKFKKRHQILNQKAQPSGKKISILEKYVSILSAGQNLDINVLLHYTVYQLFDAFERYQLKAQNDLYLSAQMAGAQGLEKPEDWMKDIH